jgi:hypothetical protein
MRRAYVGQETVMLARRSDTTGDATAANRYPAGLYVGLDESDP